MYFHFDFTNYFRMIRLAWNERNPSVRRTYLFVLLVSVPIVSTFHAICFFLDGILFPGLWPTEIRTPVFVVGHARSGTTLAHRLMSKDHGRFSSFRLYELYFPSLLQKKLIRWFFTIDRRLLGGAVEKRVRAWEDRHYAAVRAVHWMGLTEPEEDDLVFYYSCASGFWITKMPYMGSLDFYHVDRWPERRRRRLMRFYQNCVRRQLYLNGGDKIHLSKNPVFAGRVEALIETFPDACIVVPIRNPNETIPSLLKLVAGGWKRLGWDRERVNRCLRIMADQSFHTYTYPLEVLARHPRTPQAIVDYRELSADPAAAIEGIYDRLGLPMSEEYRRLLAAEGRRERSHVSGHSYSLAEFGLEADEIHRRLSDLFERYQWSAGPAAGTGDGAPAEARESEPSDTNAGGAGQGAG
jgi:hypothetical protein